MIFTYVTKIDLYQIFVGEKSTKFRTYVLSYAVIRRCSLCRRYVSSKLMRR
jgi:hypothetical protein